LNKSTNIFQNIKSLKTKVSRYENLCSQFDDLYLINSLADEENDLSLYDEIKRGYDDLRDKLDKIKLDTLLSGTYDKNNAILTFHSGAGGTEAQDWCEMLLRMYMRYAEKCGFDVKIFDFLTGFEAGIKTAAIEIIGTNAYGYLRGEKGVHRLVRISPFDASGRRHTSFASIDVMPEVDENLKIEIKTDDLRIDTFRASGAGGQHVNKTESAVRITHKPTGVVVSCQNERSQHKNKDTAMKLLKSKLIEIAEREHKSEIKDIRGIQKDNAFGSQIRSYVFHPYNMVKDHRTNYETGNVLAVMDGRIDGFISSYLKARSRGEI
jgi:peptide chain release factor 2